MAGVIVWEGHGKGLLIYDWSRGLMEFYCISFEQYT